MQNVAVFDELTVYENIDYFCGLYIEDKEKRKYDIFWVKTEQSLKTMKHPLLCFIKGMVEA